MKKPWYITTIKWTKEHAHIKGRLKINKKSKSDLVDCLYNRLTVIDDKVSSLLTFNAIMMAIVTFIMVKPVKMCDLFQYSIPLTFWAISTLLCMSINWLKWEHLDKDAENLNEYLEKIIIVSIRRTAVYNLSFVFICLSILTIVFKELIS